MATSELAVENLRPKQDKVENVILGIKRTMVERLYVDRNDAKPEGLNKSLKFVLAGEERLNPEELTRLTQNGEGLDLSEPSVLEAITPREALHILRFLCSNQWAIAYLSHNDTDDTYVSKKQHKKSILQVIDTLTRLADTEIYYDDGLSQSGIFWIKLLSNLDALSTEISLNLLTRLLQLADLDNTNKWIRQYGASADQFMYFRELSRKLSKSIELVSEVNRISMGRFNNYSMDDSGKLVTDRKTVKLDRIAKIVPPIRPETILIGQDARPDIGATWLNYEKDLVREISAFDKDSTEWKAVASEVRKLLARIETARGIDEATEIVGGAKLPLVLNLLKSELANSLKKKIHLDTGVYSQYLEPTHSGFEFKDKLYSKRILVQYLALRMLLFPSEKLEDISPESLPTHLDLASVYEFAHFERYSESNELAETKYRSDMLQVVIEQISEGVPFNIFELGSGDSWLTEQLAEIAASHPELINSINALEISQDNYIKARTRLTRFLTDNKVTLSKGSWDVLKQWPELNKRDKSKPSIFLWVGRSASHEESTEAFESTVADFSSEMAIGDFLVIDMPDPETGAYAILIDRMVEAYNQIGSQLDPPISFTREEFAYNQTQYAANFSDVISNSALPLSPLVAKTKVISAPSADHFANVPPAKNSASSGCANTPITRFGDTSEFTASLIE